MLKIDSKPKVQCSDKGLAHFSGLTNHSESSSNNNYIVLAINI